VVDPDGGDAALLALPADLSAGETTLLPALAASPLLHKAGDGVLVESLTCLGCPTRLHLLPAGGGVQLLGTLPAGIGLDRFTDGAALAACVASAAPGFELALRVHGGTGAADFPWPFVGSVGAALALAGPADDLVGGFGGVSGPQLGLRLDGPLSGAALKLPVGQITALDH